MDIFIEKMVTRKKTVLDVIISAAVVFAGLSVIIFITGISFLIPFVPLLAFLIGYVGYNVIKSRNIEFEYAMTNGDLDIDKIVAQKKRKRIFSASCKNFNIVARLNSDKYTENVKNIKKKIVAVSSMQSPDVFFTTLHYKGENVVLYFEPDERILNVLKMHIPKNVYV